MFVIKIWCLPKLTQNQLKALYRSLRLEVLSIALPRQEVFILFPSDMFEFGLGEYILIEASVDLTNPIKRTSMIRNVLAAKLGRVMKKFFSKAEITCLVSDLNIQEGFWVSRKQRPRKLGTKIKPH